MKALDFLRNMPRPDVAPGVLPPLTWALGGQMGEDLQKELAQRGYAVFADGGRVQLAGQDARMAKYSAETGAPLFTYVRRPTLEKEWMAKWMLEDAFCHDLAGARLPCLKPWLTPSCLTMLAGVIRDHLLNLKATGANVELLLHPGEDGIKSPGASVEGKKASDWWRMDPKVKERLDKLPNGERLQQYSRWKMEEVSAVYKACKEVFPNAEVIYYTTGYSTPNWYSEWQRVEWGHLQRYLRFGSDYASHEFYYAKNISGTYAPGTTKIPGLVEMATSCAGHNLLHGQPHSYDWVNGGQWLAPEDNADIALFEGYVKVLYFLGMVGCVHGYCRPPQYNGVVVGFNGDFGSECPHWLKQMDVLSRVHAWATQNFDFVTREATEFGDHPWNGIWTQPSYMGQSVPGIVVMNRGHYALAWARDGIERDVTTNGRTFRATKVGNITAV